MPQTLVEQVYSALVFKFQKCIIGTGSVDLIFSFAEAYTEYILFYIISEYISIAVLLLKYMVYLRGSVQVGILKKGCRESSCNTVWDMM